MDTHWDVSNMIYGDNPQKINERQDALGLKTYTYVPQINAMLTNTLTVTSADTIFDLPGKGSFFGGSATVLGADFVMSEGSVGTTISINSARSPLPEAHFGVSYTSIQPLGQSWFSEFFYSILSDLTRSVYYSLSQDKQKKIQEITNGGFF